MQLDDLYLGPWLPSETETERIAALERENAALKKKLSDMETTDKDKRAEGVWHKAFVKQYLLDHKALVTTLVDETLSKLESGKRRISSSSSSKKRRRNAEHPVEAVEAVQVNEAPPGSGLS